MATNVDEYLEALPDDVRAALEKLRGTIRAVVPDATETIGYQIPAFKHRGRMLVGFAAARSHCTFHLMSTSVLKAHAGELKAYALGRGSIRFAADKPLPEALVTKLVEARIAENEAAQALTARRPPGPGRERPG